MNNFLREINDILTRKNLNLSSREGVEIVVVSNREGDIHKSEDSNSFNVIVKCIDKVFTNKVFNGSIVDNVSSKVTPELVDSN